MPRCALGIEGRLPVRSRNGDCALRLRFAEKNLPAVRTESSTSSRSVTGGLSFDAYNSAFVLNRRINVESVMFRFLFLIESLRFFSGLFV